MFHNFKGSDSNDLDEINSQLWEAYKSVNKAFVQALIEFKKENDIVWIHNIYLMLAPLYLKRHDITANIGFYLHTPFPSSDIYNLFIYRNELLKSLLCCDVVGFHTFEYASNFTTTCERLLNLSVTLKKGGFMFIQYNSRNVLVKVNHIGINIQYVAENMERQEAIEFKKRLQEEIHYNKQILIGSVEKWHPISGVQNKLKAYYHFLNTYPPYRKNTCLILIVTPIDSFMQNENGEWGINMSMVRSDFKFKNAMDRIQNESWYKSFFENTMNDIKILVKQIHDKFGAGCLIYKQ